MENMEHKNGVVYTMTDVAWIGDNHFCRACYVLQAHVAFCLPTDNDFRLRLVQGSQSLSLWLSALDAAEYLDSGVR